MVREDEYHDNHREEPIVASSLATISCVFALSLTGAGAQSTIDIGVIGPFSGPWADHGKLMRVGAEMAIEDINKAGGIKSMGGAKLNMIAADTGPSVETTTNAVQRLLSQNKLAAFVCCFLSSFSLAASEIGERQQVPMLTFSYSDQLVRRGYKYIFRDSSGADTQVKAAIKLLKEQAEKAGRKIETAALVGDNTGATVSYFKSLEEVLPQNNVKIVAQPGVDAAACRRDPGRARNPFGQSGHHFSRRDHLR